MIKNLRMAVLSAIRAMSFEDRDYFVRRHIYRNEGSVYIRLNTEGLNRERAVSMYYPHYSIDNLYEYCVFRNLITLLNNYARLKNKRQFTLGHWTPMYQGGEHIACNWIIQTYEDNQKQGDSLPPEKYKWTLKEQIAYIMSKINFHFVDDKYLIDMEKYIKMLGEVYHDEKAKALRKG